MEDQTRYGTPKMQKSSHRTKTKKTECLNAFEMKDQKENQQEDQHENEKTTMR